MLADSRTPTRIPAPTAALTFPSPPSTAHVNPLTARDVPMSYCVWVMGETTQPARAPMAEAMKKESVTREGARIPHKRAAVPLEAHARIALPVSVKRKKSVSPATISPEMPRTHSTWGDMRAPRKAREEVSSPVQYARAWTFSSHT